jgi:hypothetical protein
MLLFRRVIQHHHSRCRGSTFFKKFDDTFDVGGNPESLPAAQADSRGRQVATIAAQGKEITSLESKLRQAERQLAAGRDPRGNAKEHEGDDDGTMQQRHISIEASVSALEELVRASLESARGNMAQVSCLHQELADERTMRQRAEEAVEGERMMRAKAEGQLEEERRRGLGRHVDAAADLLRTQARREKVHFQRGDFCKTHFTSCRWRSALHLGKTLHDTTALSHLSPTLPLFLPLFFPVLYFGRRALYLTWP